MSDHPSLMRRLVSLAAAASLAACSGIPTKVFEIRAIDNQGAPVKCLVVVDRQWPRGPDDAKFTDSEVDVPFRKSRMNVLVQPARIVNGVVQTPSPTEIGEYVQESRDLQIDDCRVHLFILNRNPNFGGF